MPRRPRVLAGLAATAVVIVVAGVLVLGSPGRSRPTATSGSTAAPASTSTSAATSTTSTAAAPGTSAASPAITAAAATSSSTVRPTRAPTTVVPSPAAGGTGSLAGKVVAIDPGHDGGNGAHATEINRLVPAGGFLKACDTTGTQTDAGYTESAYNFDVAQRLAADLRRQGATVVLTRSSNDGWGPCIDQRAAIGNQAHADAAISIHADGGPASGRGFHVIQPALVPGYTDNIVGPSHQLALAVRASYQGGTGMPFATYVANAGLDTRGDLGGLNLSAVPKVFIECGNMRNATDAALLISPDFRQRAADALAAGLTAYLHPA